MSQPTNNVVAMRMPNIAPLKNVLLMRSLLEQLVARSPGQPGIGVFYGFAGLGKSNACAAAHAANRGSVYVELRDHFTRKSFLAALLAEMGVRAERTIAEMFDQVCAELLLSQRALILDMGDYLVKRNLVDTLLDLYEGSKAPVVLVGEEHFPKKLKRASERFYDRVLLWRLAELADMEDTRKLAKLYSPDLDIKDDVLEKIHEAAGKVARKIATSIERERQDAKKAGLRSLSLKDRGDKPFYNGEPPTRPTPQKRRPE